MTRGGPDPLGLDRLTSFGPVPVATVAVVWRAAPARNWGRWTGTRAVGRVKGGRRPAPEARTLDATDEGPGTARQATERPAREGKAVVGPGAGITSRRCARPRETMTASPTPSWRTLLASILARWRWVTLARPLQTPSSVA
jgi:hypothetical protein